MGEGWIKLYRKIQFNEFWTQEPFSRGQAWVDLILLANHKDGFIYVRGNKVDVKRGQVAWSHKRLAERWKWSRGKVSRFLNDLENEQQIEQQKNFVTSIITISKYSEFQNNDTKRTADDTADGQQTEQQTDTNKNVKNVKNDKEYTDLLIVDLIPEIESVHCKHTLLALHIWKDVNDLRPNNKTTLNAKVKAWSDPIRLMVEQDKRTHEEIWEIWKRVRSDEFWRKNVLSTSKLREQFDRLAINFKSNKKNYEQFIDSLYA